MPNVVAGDGPQWPRETSCCGSSLSELIWVRSAKNAEGVARLCGEAATLAPLPTLRRPSGHGEAQRAPSLSPTIGLAGR
jgi:hypothetical protein